MIEKVRRYGVFAVIPCIILGCSILLKLAAGPYWLAPNFDSAYIYLANGLYLVKGIVPTSTDHPGTPLQMLYCAVCWLFNIGRSSEDAVIHVLKDPEFYLHMVFAALSLLSFGTSIALAVYVFRKTNDTLAAVLSQLPAFSYLTLKAWETSQPVIPVVAMVSSESMQISVINLFSICLLMNFFAKTSRDESAAALWLGFVCGLGVAIKLTFIPILVIPLMVLSWKNIIRFSCIFAASFVVWTLPIISKYPKIWNWISTVMTHKGVYGSGGSGILDFSVYWLNWKNIIVGEWLFAGIICAAAVFVFQKWSYKKWDKTSRFLLAAIVGVLFQFSTVAKHPGEHYLVPGLGLFNVLLVLLYLQSMARPIWGRKITFVFVSAAMIAGTCQAMVYRSNLAKLTRDVSTFYEHVHAEYQGYAFLGFYRSSGMESALRFGCEWTGDSQFSDELDKIYPHSFFFNRGGSNRIVNFKERVLSDDLLTQYSGIIFQGDDSYGDLDSSLKDSPFTVRLLEKGRLESIYLLTGTTEKQAEMAFWAAAHFFQTGDYNRALGFAVQAKAFHYQPQDSVDDFIKMTIPYVHH